MITLTLNANDFYSIENDLSKALVKFSYGKLNVIQANKLAKSVVPKMDFSNSALAHKGVNWYAKEILDVVDYKALAAI